MLRGQVLLALIVGVAGSGATAHAMPAAAPLKAAVAVSENPVQYNSDVYLSVATEPAATCVSKVVYNDNSQPSNWQSQYKNKSFRAARNGVIIWTWHFKKRGLSSARATVTCTKSGATTSTTLVFKLA
jgi:hypothetical protein